MGSSSVLRKVVGTLTQGGRRVQTTHPLMWEGIPAPRCSGKGATKVFPPSILSAVQTKPPLWLDGVGMRVRVRVRV